MVYRSRRYGGVLLPLPMFLLLLGGASLRLQAAQQQYALNRQLIEAVIESDYRQSLDLVMAGADPNARYAPYLPPGSCNCSSKFSIVRHPLSTRVRPHLRLP